MFDQTALLRQNLEEIEACGEAFTASLYARLFTLYPETAHLFANTCMQEQQQKLLMTFVLILDHLDDPAYLAATLRRLGHSTPTMRFSPPTLRASARRCSIRLPNISARPGPRSIAPCGVRPTSS